MKQFYVALFIILINYASLAQSAYETPVHSKISEALKNKKTVHLLKSWQLYQTKSVQKSMVSIDAIVYTNMNSNEQLKGLKITIKSKHKNGFGNPATNGIYEWYIDQQDYAELLVVINQFIASYKKSKWTRQYTTASYTTKNELQFGYQYTEDIKIGFLSFAIDTKRTRVEFPNIEKFLTQFKYCLEIASKELYLPQNIEKIKKVKKSKQEVKDVKTDDI